MSKYIEKAKELRAITDVHYNCAQSVLVPFAKEMGMTEEQAYNLGYNFGAGMKRGSAVRLLLASWLWVCWESMILRICRHIIMLSRAIMTVILTAGIYWLQVPRRVRIRRLTVMAWFMRL